MKKMGKANILISGASFFCALLSAGVAYYASKDNPLIIGRALTILGAGIICCAVLAATWKLAKKMPPPPHLRDKSSPSKSKLWYRLVFLTPLLGILIATYFVEGARTFVVAVAAVVYITASVAAVAALGWL